MLGSLLTAVALNHRLYIFIYFLPGEITLEIISPISAIAGEVFSSKGRARMVS